MGSGHSRHESALGFLGFSFSWECKLLKRSWKWDRDIWQLFVAGSGRHNSSAGQNCLLEALISSPFSSSTSWSPGRPFEGTPDHNRAKTNFPTFIKRIPQSDPQSQQDAQKFLKSAPAGSSPRAGDSSCGFSKEEALSFLNNFVLPLFLSGTTIQELEEMVNHNHVVWGIEHYLITPWVWKNHLLSPNFSWFLQVWWAPSELFTNNYFHTDN